MRSCCALSSLAMQVSALQFSDYECALRNIQVLLAFLWLLFIELKTCSPRAHFACSRVKTRSFTSLRDPPIPEKFSMLKTQRVMPSVL
jgi:hypothetical protein